MKFAWATRGKHWGFRFLESGGLVDPRAEYLRMFTSDGSATFFKLSDAGLALRFADPEGRTDSAGRVIPHEFIVSPPVPAAMSTLDEAITVLWPEVASQYSRIWDSPNPPPRGD